MILSFMSRDEFNSLSVKLTRSDMTSDLGEQDQYYFPFPTRIEKDRNTMSTDPGVKKEKEEEGKKEDIKSYPYLASLNPAQLKGKLRQRKQSTN